MRQRSELPEPNTVAVSSGPVVKSEGADPKCSAPKNAVTGWQRGALMLMLVVAITSGIMIRFTRLGEKYFWFDEVHSAAVVAGGPVQVVDDMFDGKERRLIDLQELLRLKPGRPISTTVDALIGGNPENTPLYFLSLRLWAEAFGDDPATLRRMSAVIGVVSGVLLLWLCRELRFSGWSTGCVIAWWSLTPFFVLYGQEARTYSLFSLTVILANAALLRALRVDTRLGWAGYGLSVAIGLYTHMFFGLLMVAHAAYIFALGRMESTSEARRRTYVRYGVTSACAVLLFLPWFLVFLSHARHEELAKFLVKRKWPDVLLRGWIEGLGTLLVDLGFHETPLRRNIAFAVAVSATGVLVWALRAVWRTAPRPVSLFILATALVPPLMLILPDLIAGGGKSQVVRYWLPGMVSFGVAFGYAFGNELAKGSRRSFAAAIVLLCVALYSADRSFTARAWWTKGGIVGEIGLFIDEDREQRRVLPEIAEVPNALLVVEHDHLKAFEILAMSTMSDPRLVWVGTKEPEHFEPPADRVVYLYRGPELVESLGERGWDLESLDNSEKFRRVSRPPEAAPASE